MLLAFSIQSLSGTDSDLCALPTKWITIIIIIIFIIALIIILAIVHTNITDQEKQLWGK